MKLKKYSATELPENFGIDIDGWDLSLASVKNNTRFVAGWATASASIDSLDLSTSVDGVYTAIHFGLNSFESGTFFAGPIIIAEAKNNTSGGFNIGYSLMNPDELSYEFRVGDNSAFNASFTYPVNDSFGIDLSLASEDDIETVSFGFTFNSN